MNKPIKNDTIAPVLYVAAPKSITLANTAIETAEVPST